METAIIEALKCCIEDKCRDCSYSRLAQSGVCLNELHKDILDLLTKVHISISECRFGSISAFLVRILFIRNLTKFCKEQDLTMSHMLRKYIKEIIANTTEKN